MAADTNYVNFSRPLLLSTCFPNIFPCTMFWNLCMLGLAMNLILKEYKWGRLYFTSIQCYLWIRKAWYLNKLFMSVAKITFFTTSAGYIWYDWRIPARDFLLYHCRLFLLRLAAKQIFGRQKSWASVLSCRSVALTSNTRAKINFFPVCLDHPQARLLVTKASTLKEILIIMTYKRLWRWWSYHGSGS